jgi:hypothetical protein
MVDMVDPQTIDKIEFRRLLTELKDLSPDTFVRVRFIGEMWQNNHCRIIKVTDKGVVINDEKANRLIFIQDLSKIIQFEIDQTFRHFQPHFHYSIGNSFW